MNIIYHTRVYYCLWGVSTMMRTSRGGGMSNITRNERSDACNPGEIAM